MPRDARPFSRAALPGSAWPLSTRMAAAGCGVDQRRCTIRHREIQELPVLPVAARGGKAQERAVAAGNDNVLIWVQPTPSSPLGARATAGPDKAACAWLRHTVAVRRATGGCELGIADGVVGSSSRRPAAHGTARLRTSIGGNRSGLRRLRGEGRTSVPR